MSTGGGGADAGGAMTPQVVSGLQQALTGNSFSMPGGMQASPMSVQMNPMSMGMGVLNADAMNGGGVSDGTNSGAFDGAKVVQALSSMRGAASGNSGAQPQNGASSPYRFGGGGGMARAGGAGSFMPSSAIASPFGTGNAASLLQQIMQQANSQIG